MSTLYFEDLFASTVALQVHLFLPLVIEKMCYGCRAVSCRQSDHLICQMGEIFFFVRFQDVLNMVNKDRVEAQFRIYAYPRANFIFEDAWFEGLWTNQDWLQLVQDKVINLRIRLMDL